MSWPGANKLRAVFVPPFLCHPSSCNSSAIIKLVSSTQHASNGRAWDPGVVGIVQWWNVGLWLRMMWVRVPLPTPTNLNFHGLAPPRHAESRRAGDPAEQAFCLPRQRPLCLPIYHPELFTDSYLVRLKKLVILTETRRLPPG